jgi:hypothetical protein
MKSVRNAIEDYIALRRSLGFKLHGMATSLGKFASFLEQKEAPYIKSFGRMQPRSAHRDEARCYERSVPAFVGERLARGRISLFSRRCATHIPCRVSYLCWNLTIFTISGAANNPELAGHA